MNDALHEAARKYEEKRDYAESYKVEYHEILNTLNAEISVLKQEYDTLREFDETWVWCKRCGKKHRRSQIRNSRKHSLDIRNSIVIYRVVSCFCNYAKSIAELLH